ncbi:MAG: hypothetical protein IPO81_09735 [Kouleothrix sp.]|nr:hypothetical protein [Kouleothrix sp.]
MSTVQYLIFKGTRPPQDAAIWRIDRLPPERIVDLGQRLARAQLAAIPLVALLHQTRGGARLEISLYYWQQDISETQPLELLARYGEPIRMLATMADFDGSLWVEPPFLWGALDAMLDRHQTVV